MKTNEGTGGGGVPHRGEYLTIRVQIHDARENATNNRQAFERFSF